MPIDHTRSSLKRFIDHIYAHPQRAIGTVLLIIALGWSAAGIALAKSIEAAHQGRVENCRAINELRREIYVAATDLGAAPSVTVRFLPTERCEDIP